MSEVNLLKTKLADWNERMNGQDVHSIYRQLASLLWRSAFYRAINASRKFLPDGKDGEKEANGPLHELIDEGFFTVQAAAIRRLLDREGKPTSHRRGVYSLHGLLEDIRNHAHLLTRANVLAARGLEYNFEACKEYARQEAWAKARVERNRGTFVSSVGWRDAEHWHEIMDSLCGVSADRRLPTDAPSVAKIGQIAEQLSEHGRLVRDYVDKYIAHASSPASRSLLPSDHQSLSLAKLWRAERVLMRASFFVAYHFVDGVGIGSVPIPEFDHFAFLDRPFIESSARDVLQKAWDHHSMELQPCRRWFWDQPLSDESDVWSDSAW